MKSISIKTLLCALLSLLITHQSLCRGGLGAENQAELSKQITSGDSEQRIAAIERAAKIDTSKSAPGDALIDALIVSLTATDTDVRAAAASALAQYGPSAAKATPVLISQLRPGNYTTAGVPVWNFNSEALGSFGEVAVPQLLKALETENETQFQGVCAAFHNMLPKLDDATAKQVIQHLGEHLASETGVRRWTAAYAIVDAGPRGSDLVPQLITALEDEDFRAVMMSCQALANIGPPAAPAVKKLMSLSSEGVTSVRGHSALALGKIGPVEEFDIAGRLTAMLEDPNATVSERAVIGLGSLGPQAIDALDEITTLLEQKSFRSRSEAAYTHWRISGKPQPAVDRLLEFMQQPDYELDSIFKLGEMGAVAESAVPDLIRKFESGDESVQAEVCLALAAIGTDNAEVRRVLKNGSDSQSESVRLAAQAAVMQLDGR